MSTTVNALLVQHPQNLGRNTEYTSDSRKEWAKKFEPINDLRVHTRIEPDSSVTADFSSAFLPAYGDDDFRVAQPANPPNDDRDWYLRSESDGTNWFNTEVSNSVLAGFTRYPRVRQTLEAVPVREDVRVSETVDMMYSMTLESTGQRAPLAIGEMKRNLLEAREWQTGRLKSAAQVRLSQELRGYVYIRSYFQRFFFPLYANILDSYAIKYQCPQVFCFDIGYLVLLQFRAQKEKEMTDARTPVDCWVLPQRHESPGGCTLRYALYKLLVQGFRRCQNLVPLPVPAGGLQPEMRQYFSGKPMWKLPGGIYPYHPDGYDRQVDTAYGNFFWTKDGVEVVDETGRRIWDTAACWQLPAGQAWQDVQQVAG